MADSTKYSHQRNSVTPPHVSLKDLRRAVGLTIDELIARIPAQPDKKPTRGAISAIENGHRGASRELLDGIAAAYGLPPGSISTTYLPRAGAGRPHPQAAA